MKFFFLKCPHSITLLLPIPVPQPMRSWPSGRLISVPHFSTSIANPWVRVTADHFPSIWTMIESISLFYCNLICFFDSIFWVGRTAEMNGQIYRILIIRICVWQLNVVDGKKQYLFDENGRRYLDGFGGIATVCCGHSHPDVVDAVINQIKRIQHSTVLYLNHAIADFAEALASKMPGNLKVCHQRSTFHLVFAFCRFPLWWWRSQYVGPVVSFEESS